MPGDEEIRSKAVSAVLDNGMTQVSVCKRYGITPHRLRKWLTEERLRRAQLADIVKNRVPESADARRRRLATDWAQYEVQESHISEGLKRAHRAHVFFDYVIGGPLLAVAVVLDILIGLIAVVIILEVFAIARNAWYAVLMSLLIAVVALVIVAVIWVLAQYFRSLIFRSFAPFSFAVYNLEQSWLLLEQSQEAIFPRPRNEQEKLTRLKITARIGGAAHVLDATRRAGRDHGSRTSKLNERTARRKVAAFVAKAEELLHDKGRPGRMQAIEILQIAAYETVLRKWTLHEFTNVPDPEPISIWRRRIAPFLKGVVAFGSTFGPIAWQVFGAEDQSPGHLIRVFLQSRGLLNQ